MTNKNTLILGCGYVGSFFLQQNPNIYYTNRTNKKLDPKNTNSIFFDLNDEKSWSNLPETKNVLWTFSAADNEIQLQKALLFYNKHLKNKNVVILSSTSAYKQNKENEVIDETSPLKLEEPRFFAEEQLRKEGALILHLSGIIGPHRTPLGWYQKNLVQYENNILNYIHTKEIIFFIEALFKKFVPGERFNLTSADYKTHYDIAQLLIKMNLLEPGFKFLNTVETKNSKKIQNTKLLNYLQKKNTIFTKYPEDVEIIVLG